MLLKYPILLDGGLSNVLISFGCQVNHKLWTAQLLDKDPESIIKAHLKYLEAGARCIITASYQASIPGFIESGLNRNEAEKLLMRSVELAEKAVETYQNNGGTDKIIIAASIGPYGAYLSDGSEYRGEYDISDKELREFHQERFHVLEKSNSHIYACETIPNYQEAKILNELVEKLKKPVWLAFACKDDKHLNDGSHIGECVRLFKGNKNIHAMGVNCTDPIYVLGLIKEIKKADKSRRVVVYPNSGEQYDSKRKIWSEKESQYPFIDQAKEWMNAGVDIIGGCCRVGPKLIKKLHEEFFDHNLNQTLQ